MKFLDKDVAVCLVPHPDDTAISMSNLVKRFSGTKFHMVYMSLGTNTDPTTGHERMVEEDRFWEIFGVQNVYKHTIQNCTFDGSSTSSWISSIDRLLKSIGNVKVIFVPSSDDSHYEHRFTNELVYPITRFSPCTILEYRTASSLHTWTPNFFSRVTDEELTFKINCIRRAYKSQLDSPYLSKTSLTAFHTDFLNMKRNYEMSEMFNLKQFYW
jgi:LmbE family N-acetylglucosaminyl deacetylase